MNSQCEKYTKVCTKLNTEFVDFVCEIVLSQLIVLSDRSPHSNILRGLLGGVARSTPADAFLWAADVFLCQPQPHSHS